ncbi:MAG TPA: hypothetical protein VHZ78_03385 [Rhizomicrobium sp.]|jgi:hypothetical protein|nr:hypothetical protein [Rhizomicrobium sp.]
MDFSSRYPIRQLTVLAQDPSVTGPNGKALTITVPVPSETLAPGPKGYRIQIVDFDSSDNRYYAPAARPNEDRYLRAHSTSALIADRDFHAQNTFGHVATTLAQFESALGRHVNWAFESGAHHIKVAPHAFLDANAFYSRRDEALCFGYFAIDAGGRAARARDYVYTCLSADIVTHETTHAILDGLRRELMRPSTPDQPAFHEGFADIVALLSALSRPELLRLVLPVVHGKGRELIATADLAPGALRQSVLLGLAKQFGKTLAAQNLMNRSATALRRSVEIDPKIENYGTLKNGEAHVLGEIIVAALLNAFVEIWYARARTLDPVRSGYADRDRAIEDGSKAAQHLLHMAIRAIDYIPPINMTYPDYLTALLTVDRELTQGQRGKFDYRTHIVACFARYGIAPVTDSSCWDPPKLPRNKRLCYGYSGHAEMMWDREAIMRFLWENRAALGVSADALTAVNFVKPSIRTGPDGLLLRETIVEYMQLLDVTGADLKKLKIRKPDDMPSSAPVRLLGGGTLVFDDYGGLKFNIGSGVASRHQSDHVANTWRAGPQALGLRRFEALHRERMLGPAPDADGGW